MKSDAFGTRDDVVRRVRQRRIVVALGPLLEGHFQGSSSGDLEAGHYEAHDGSGNFFVVHWDASGVVALGFDHDAPGSEYAKPLQARRPERQLRGVPASMRALADRASEYGERLATEGFWIAAGTSPAHGESETLDVLEQLGADDTGEVWLAGAEKIGELAGRIAAHATYEVTPDDERAFLALAAARKKPLDAGHVEQVAEALARVGVVWRDAVAHAKATIEAQLRAHDARFPPTDRALLHAAHAGDLEAVKRALAAGANIDARAPAEELLFTPEGATPLIVALRRGHRGVADHLIDAGADLDASYRAWGGPDCPLRIAAATGDVELCRRLLAAPGRRDATRVLAQMVDDAPRIESIRAEAAQRGDEVGSPAPEAVASDCAAIMRLLLDAGAAVPRRHGDRLAQMAERGGAPEVAARLGQASVPNELPVVAPLPDAEASREAISRGLERAADAIARDAAAALEALLPAWRASLHPRIGDAAEQLAVRVRGEVTYAIGPGAVDEKSYAALRDALEAPSDPRTARAALRGLMALSPISSDPTIVRAEDALAALLVQVRDGRYIEALEQHVERERPVTVRRLRESVHVALAAMKEVRPAALSTSDLERLGAIEDVLAQRAPRPAGSKGPTTHDLFAAVYDDPDADAPRPRRTPRRGRRPARRVHPPPARASRKERRGHQAREGPPQAARPPLARRAGRRPRRRPGLRARLPRPSGHRRRLEERSQ